MTVKSKIDEVTDENAFYLLPLLAVCKTKLDLAILIDASQKPADTDLIFRRYIQFIKQLISGFNIGQYGTHVGIVVFSLEARVIFGFQRYYNLWTLLKAIDSMRYSQRGARIGNALEEVRTKLFGASARPGMPKMVLVVTDTVSQVSFYIQKGVTCFSINQLRCQVEEITGAMLASL